MHSLVIEAVNNTQRTIGYGSPPGTGICGVGIDGNIIAARAICRSTISIDVTSRTLRKTDILRTTGIEAESAGCTVRWRWIIKE